MKSFLTVRPQKLIVLVFALCMLTSIFSIQSVFGESTDILNLRIIGTSDLHVNLVNYDYYKDTPTNEFGLVKTATLIKKARSEVKNSLLFDNGDLLQGNPLGDYIARVKGLKENETHPAFKALNLLGYDAATLGNHEFNYGLDFLNTALKGANFPYVSGNIVLDDHDNNPNNDPYYVKPYIILEKTLTTETGSQQKLKIGVLGLTPPQIMQWDKGNLEGKLKTTDMVESAQKLIPQMKAEGAEIIILLAHTGIDITPAKGMDENTGYYLSKIEGIQAMILGHSHQLFPDGKSYANIPDIDNKNGLLNGVATVLPGSWGNNLGIIDLKLTKVNGKYTVVESKAQLRSIYDSAAKNSLADADSAVLYTIKTEHEATIQYVRGPVGETTAPIHSFFALVQDDPSIQIVTNAQKWYVEKTLKGTQYEGIPVLSAGAPFKCGGRGGASYYTDIPKGTIAIKNVSDLYIYPNTVYAVLLKGKEIKEWLEWSAGQFLQINPTNTGEQNLINNDFPTYNYDVIDGITYQIDVTQPPKYNVKCEVINPVANRIKNLMYQGKPIDPEKLFVVATNNYRASFTKVANPDGKRIILASPDENRQAVIDYINALKIFNPSADNNWTFAPIQTNATVVFESSPSAKSYAEKTSVIKYLSTQDNGFAKYTIKL